jgi:hypothetical protein
LAQPRIAEIMTGNLQPRNDALLALGQNALPGGRLKNP